MQQAIQFLKEVRAELNKVVWPTRQQTIRYTVIVVAVSLTIGLYLSILDQLFGNVITKIIAQ